MYLYMYMYMYTYMYMYMYMSIYIYIYFYLYILVGVRDEISGANSDAGNLKCEWRCKKANAPSQSVRTLTMSGAGPHHHHDNPQTGAAPKRSINLKTRPCTVC